MWCDSLMALRLKKLQAKLSILPYLPCFTSLEGTCNTEGDNGVQADLKR